ncbi:MAG: hypothetical protein N4A76_08480 [Firmicutes bacterium]|jgi:hypothetical protein|nr:hypothetical protein [Bacillota bacterium]
MDNIAISTSAFCLWDIGPKRKLDICKDLGFKRVVIAFSTIKMLRTFSSMEELYPELNHFDEISVLAPWRGVKYGNNKLTHEIIALMNSLTAKTKIDSVVFNFDCITDFSVFKGCAFKYHIKNPNRASWSDFKSAKEEHDFNTVLDINRATRFDSYIDNYIDNFHNEIASVYISGYNELLGRTPIIESNQIPLLDHIKDIKAPLVIEGLFTPGDFDSIRNEIDLIKSVIN